MTILNLAADNGMISYYARFLTEAATLVSDKAAIFEGVPTGSGMGRVVLRPVELCPLTAPGYLELDPKNLDSTSFTTATTAEDNETTKLGPDSITTTTPSIADVRIVVDLEPTNITLATISLAIIPESHHPTTGPKTDSLTTSAVLGDSQTESSLNPSSWAQMRKDEEEMFNSIEWDDDDDFFAVSSGGTPNTFLAVISQEDSETEKLQAPAAPVSLEVATDEAAPAVCSDDTVEAGSVLNMLPAHSIRQKIIDALKIFDNSRIADPLKSNYSVYRFDERRIRYLDGRFRPALERIWEEL